MAAPRSILTHSDNRSKWNAGASAIPNGSAVKQGAGDDAITIATASNDVVLGLLTGGDLERGAVRSGPYLDVQIRNLAIGIAGTGGVTRGDRLTVDPAKPGRLIKAQPSTGTTVTIVGVANRTASDGERFEVELAGPGASLTG